MAIAKNIFEESRPLFFITGLVGLRPPRICSKTFPGYLYVAVILLAYYLIYLFTLNDTLAFYDALSVYTKIAKTRWIQKFINFFFLLIMILSSVSSSSKVRQIYIEINVVDEKMKLLNMQFDYVVSMKKELIHVCQVIIVTILFNLMEYYPQIGPDTNKIFDLLWIVDTLPQFINSLVIATFVIVISKIRRRFEAINESIQNLMILEKNVISTLESEMNNLFRLRLLNRTHEKLSNAATTLNDAHGPILLTSFVVYFLTSCVHLRIVTLNFGETNNIIDFIVEFLWTLFYIGKYVYIIDACHNVTLQIFRTLILSLSVFNAVSLSLQQGKLSGRLLCEKYTDADNHPLKNEMDAMARRLESRVLQLTACNFFVIDYPMLKKIVVTLAIYVYFVSQFSPNSTQTK